MCNHPTHTGSIRRLLAVDIPALPEYCITASEVIMFAITDESVGGCTLTHVIAYEFDCACGMATPPRLNPDRRSGTCSMRRVYNCLMV